MKEGHRAKDCRITRKCRRCGLGHHQSICTREQQTAKNNSSQNNIHCATCQSHTQGGVERQMTVFKDNGNVGTGENDSKGEEPLVTVSGTVKSKNEVMLKTARVLAQCQESEKSVPVRLLLDDGSQKSYVTNSLKVQLKNMSR